MIKIEIEGQPPHTKDHLRINVKKRFVLFSAYIDGCGNDFKIEKEDLIKLIIP